MAVGRPPSGLQHSYVHARVLFPSTFAQHLIFVAAMHKKGNSSEEHRRSSPCSHENMDLDADALAGMNQEQAIFPFEAAMVRGVLALLVHTYS